MKRTILLLTVLLLGTQSYAGDIKAIKTNDQFQEVAKITQLDQIKINTPPVTQYTPKDLHKQTIVSFQGRNSETGAYTVWSQTFTDYNTKVIKSYMKDGRFYIEDNTGKTFVTGVDYSNEVQQATKAIQTNANNIKQVSTVVKTNTNNIKALGTNLQRLDQKVDRVIDGVYQLNDKVDKGLATVTALTSLHPNPRFKGKTQVAIGSGVYNNNVAGAVGIFHYVNDNVMVSIGASYGGSNSWAGNVGLSIGF